MQTLKARLNRLVDTRDRPNRTDFADEPEGYEFGSSGGIVTDSGFGLFADPADPPDEPDTYIVEDGVIVDSDGSPITPTTVVDESGIVDDSGSGGSGGSGTGGGIASPLQEQSRIYAATTNIYTSPDGMYQFAVKRVRRIRMIDGNGAQIDFDYDTS